jgi:hypothetical protein
MLTIGTPDERRAARQAGKGGDGIGEAQGIGDGDQKRQGAAMAAPAWGGRHARHPYHSVQLVSFPPGH